MLLALLYVKLTLAITEGSQQIAANTSTIFDKTGTQTSSVASRGAMGRVVGNNDARAGLGPGASDNRHQDADVG